jgi:hypothetical protein
MATCVGVFFFLPCRSEKDELVRQGSLSAGTGTLLHHWSADAASLYKGSSVSFFNHLLFRSSTQASG